MSRDLTLGRIRLRHLQCFLAVARQGNLRRAAHILAVTQPAVTKTLNELEEMLGAPLFVRSRKGATLTSEGELFMRHANASVESLVHAVDSIVSGPGEAPLRIGVLPTVAPSFLPQVLAAFASHRPAAALRVHTGRNKDLLEMLRGRELDAVIGRLSDPDVMVGLTFEHLYAEPLIVVGRAGHPLFVHRPAGEPAPSAFAAHTLVLPLAGTMIRQLADGFLGAHGWVPGGRVVETLDIALARALVFGADALWLTPLGGAQPDLERGDMVRLTTSIAPEITPAEPVGLLLRTDTPSSATLQAWLHAVREAAAALRGRAAQPAVARPDLHHHR
jgi:LysR family pca operon transcriptional activator